MSVSVLVSLLAMLQRVETCTDCALDASANSQMNSTQTKRDTNPTKQTLFQATQRKHFSSLAESAKLVSAICASLAPNRKHWWFCVVSDLRFDVRNLVCLF